MQSLALEGLIYLSRSCASFSPFSSLSSPTWYQPSGVSTGLTVGAASMVPKRVPTNTQNKVTLGIGNFNTFTIYNTILIFP